jgi:hypothetical protein
MAGQEELSGFGKTFESGPHARFARFRGSIEPNWHLGSGVHDINRRVVKSGIPKLHRVWEWLRDHLIKAIILAALAWSATAYQTGVFDAIIGDVLPKGASCEANIVLFLYFLCFC